MRPPCKQNRPQKAVVNSLQSSRGAFVSVVSRLFALFHFLTLVNNLPIFQGTIHGNVYAV